MSPVRGKFVIRWGGQFWNAAWGWGPRRMASRYRDTSWPLPANGRWARDARAAR